MDPITYWNEIIKSPRLILAPMVDHSELPWRLLSRKYGCQAAYTPMFHAASFATSKKYRQKNFTTCDEDRPLFVQFCANKADTLIEAARFVQESCNGIDLNLGCPQEIAKRGRYGAFLQDEWELIEEIVTRLRANVSSELGVSCKIRRFNDLSRTLDYAKMLEKAGCTFIGIHGRTREQRGVNTGLADWNYIKAVKDVVKIPVVANGNVQSLTDANECLEYTGADAVMTAEGNLYNPCLFLDTHPPAWIVAKEYLDIVQKHPIPVGMAKSHLFKLFHRCIAMDDNVDLRAKLGQSTTLEQLYEVVACFETKYAIKDCDQSMPILMQPVPPYLCQPRFRYNATKTNNTTANDSDNSFKNSDQKRIKLSS